MDRQVQELIIYQQGSPVPSECEALRDIDLQSAYFQELVTQHMSAQSIPTTVAVHIEFIAREQSKSSLWHQLHNGGFTSSVFGDIIHRRESTAPDNLIKCIMGYGDHHVTTKVMAWGLANESKAQRACVQHCESLGQIVTVVPSGLSSHSYLGASGDGWVCQEDARVGMLEVKRPFSIEKDMVTSIHPGTLAENPKFYLEMQAGRPTLKRLHKYYYQVQGELAITRMPWCDFVVWTEGGLFIERISFGEELWKSIMLPKLIDCYTRHVVPELLCRRL